MAASVFFYHCVISKNADIVSSRVKNITFSILSPI